MGRILLAQELGLSRPLCPALGQLAAALEAAGHQVDLALAQPTAAAPLATADRRILPAPHTAPRPQSRLPLTYADVLAANGYDTGPGLSGLVRAWLHLYEGTQPDLVLAWQAPTALLAARIVNLQAAAAGTGYHLPLPQTPLPSLLPWKDIPQAQLAASDAAVLQRLNPVLAAHGAAALQHLAELFDLPARFLCTWPELDHYGPRAEADYLGPLSEPTGMAPAPLLWAQAESPRVLAYIEPGTPYFTPMIQALVAQQISVLLHAPGLPAQTQKAVADSTVRLCDQAPDAEAIATADAVVCHGDHALCAALLRAGRPLLILPYRHDQMLLGAHLARHGLAVTLQPAEAPQNYLKALQHLFENPDYAVHAAGLAAQYSADAPERPLEAMAQQIARMLNAP